MTSIFFLAQVAHCLSAVKNLKRTNEWKILARTSLNCEESLKADYSLFSIKGTLSRYIWFKLIYIHEMVPQYNSYNKNREAVTKWLKAISWGKSTLRNIFLKLIQRYSSHLNSWKTNGF